MVNTDQFLIRKAVDKDFEKIYSLYNLVSRTTAGLARTESEITKDYVKQFFEKSSQNGIQFTIVDKLNDEEIIAEIHCYKLEPRVFGHILSELMIAVSTKYQGTGFGKKLFQMLIEDIMENRNDIFRVELIARKSNTKAIKLYETLGFKIEGTLVNRIKNNENLFEADIPMAWLNPNFIP